MFLVVSRGTLLLRGQCGSQSLAILSDELENAGQGAVQLKNFLTLSKLGG
jgi:hypothetical protein